jgi:hypothetical protein
MQSQIAIQHLILTTDPLLNRGMTVEEKIMYTHIASTSEKLFFRIIYETQLRPFEVLNLLVEQWDRNQGLLPPLKSSRRPNHKGDHHAKLATNSETRPSLHQQMRCSGNTSNRKGAIFINENGDMPSLNGSTRRFQDMQNSWNPED